MVIQYRPKLVILIISLLILVILGISIGYLTIDRRTSQGDVSPAKLTVPILALKKDGQFFNGYVWLDGHNRARTGSDGKVVLTNISPGYYHVDFVGFDNQTYVQDKSFEGNPISVQDFNRDGRPDITRQNQTGFYIFDKLVSSGGDPGQQTGGTQPPPSSPPAVVELMPPKPWFPDRYIDEDKCNLSRPRAWIRVFTADKTTLAPNESVQTTVKFLIGVGAYGIDPPETPFITSSDSSIVEVTQNLQQDPQNSHSWVGTITAKQIGDAVITAGAGNMPQCTWVQLPITVTLTQ